MKESRYNYFIKHGDRTICFNGLSGKVFTVTKKELDLLCKILKYSYLQDRNQSMTQWLANYNFLVDENMDEVEKFRFKNHSEVFNGFHQLILNPTLECNFRCWYCYEQHPEGHMSMDTIEQIKAYIDSLISKESIKGFTLGWFGGEPLLYFNQVVYPLSLYIKNQMDKYGLPFEHNMTTNGYLINNDMTCKFNEIGLRSFQITLDGDRETHNKTRHEFGKPSFDRIVNNVISICENIPQSNVILRINYTNEIIAKDYGLILNVIPQNVRGQIQVHFQRVWQTAGVSAPCDKDVIRNITTLRDMGFVTTPTNFYTVNRAHVCYADRYNYAHINYDGRVYKCTARDYSEERSIGALKDNGVIEWKSDTIEKMYNKGNFENEKCVKCKHLPLCGGPCLQQNLDYKEGVVADICKGKHKELDVNTFIREYYLNVKQSYGLKNT